MVKRAALGVLVVGVLAIGAAAEMLSGTIRFWLNESDVSLFQKQFPDAEYFGNLTIEGLTTDPIAPRPRFVVARLHLSYWPHRNRLVVELVERPESHVLAVRDRLVFPEPDLRRILRSPIDAALFDQFDSLYPNESPAPTDRPDSD